jgi:4-azaleucine resistance transporter AzlC
VATTQSDSKDLDTEYKCFQEISMNSPVSFDELASSPSSSSSGECVRGMRASLPILFGLAPIALVLGAQAAQMGLSAIAVPLITGLNFAGGSEFAAISLWTSPPHIALIVAMSMLVNARHILMGAAFAPLMRHVALPRALASLFLMCDESWAMTVADANSRRANHISMPYYVGMGVLCWLTWIAFTTLGALMGPVLGDIRQYGLDMAFTAVFLVLLRGMWKGVRASRPWLVSLVVAAAVYRFVPGAWYVPAGACSGLVAAILVGSRNA